MVLNQAAARLGQSLRETEDELMRSLLESTASWVNCVGGVNGDNPTEPTAVDFEGVVTALQNSDAEFIGDVVEGENKFGTGPVRDSYFCMAHTALIPRLQAMNGFISKAQYPLTKVVDVKPLVIDLELFSNKDNKAQAKAA